MHSKLRKITKNKTPVGRDLYTSLRRDYKKAIITAKQEGWKKFTSKIKHPSDVSKLIKSFKNSKNNALGSVKKNKDGDYCDNPTESLNILLSKFFPGHASLSETEIRSWDDEGMDWNVVKNNQLNNTFTIKKVKAAFAHMGSYKLAGPNGVKPIVMKKFGPRALECITIIFKAIYSTGNIPIEFCKSKVVFIPKPLKDYYGDAGSFRPISLFKFLFKTMERVIDWSLREHANKMGQISDMQHAYKWYKRYGHCSVHFSQPNWKLNYQETIMPCYICWYSGCFWQLGIYGHQKGHDWQ